MGIAKRAGLRISVPRVEFTSDGYHKVNVPQSIGYLFLFGVVIITLFLISSVVFYWGHTLYTKTTNPPKVVTHTIYQSKLEAEQQAFIEQCKQNEQKDSYNHGVPNVTVEPWTCTYAK